MKSTKIVSLLALAIGAVGFVTVLTVGHRRAEAGLNAKAGSDADPPPGIGNLTELRPAEVQRAPVMAGLVPSGEVDARGEESPEASGGGAEGPAESPRVATLAELQEFREYVAGSLLELRKQRAADELRALEERVARLDETVTRLEDSLELTPHQSDKLRSVLLSQFDREAEYVRLREEGADEEILGELKASDRVAQSSELASFLTPEQLATYRLN